MTSHQPRVAVVTGVSSGIGRQIATQLAGSGWRVIGTGRDAARMEQVEREIRSSPDAQVDMLRADLSLLEDAAQLADRIAAITDRVDLLVNNAGSMTDTLVMTAEGYEANYAGNHLGPFVLTQKLLPLLRKAAAQAPAGTVRILNTASDASEMLPAIDLENLQNLGRFSPGLAYCAGKLANVLFAKGLAARLAGEGIVAHSVHPGAVDTGFFSHAPADTQERTRNISKATPQQGADTLVWLATSAEGAENSGGYWHQRQLREPNPLANDPLLVARFWDATERLIAKQ